MARPRFQPRQDVGNTQDINPEIGITGTPAIDSSTKIFVCGSQHQGKRSLDLPERHALDIATGVEKIWRPHVLTASAPGTAADGKRHQQRTVQLAVRENQRPGLLVQGGYVFDRLRIARR